MNDRIISFMSLIVALIALFYVLCIGVKENTFSYLIAILSTLVTLLVGWNIVQYMYAKDEVRNIARKESNKAAAQAAQTVVRDLSKVFKGQNFMKRATEPGRIGDELQRIDFIFQALELYKSCENPLIASSSLDGALLCLQAQFEYLQGKNLLCVLEGKKPLYESILKDLQSPNIKVYSDLLSEVEEISQEEYSKKLSPDDLEGFRFV